MAKDLEEFVNINCCNQMGERAKFIEIIQSLEALVEEAYEEGYNCAKGWYDDGRNNYPYDYSEYSDFKDSTVKKQLDELNKEVE